jgi:hypothetical protein
VEENLVSSLVVQVTTEVEERLLMAKKLQKALNVKNTNEATKAKAASKGTMKWLGFMSSFILEKMCSLFKTGVRTDKGFRKCILLSSLRLSTSTVMPRSGVQLPEEVEGVLAHH